VNETKRVFQQLRQQQQLEQVRAQFLGRVLSAQSAALAMLLDEDRDRLEVLVAMLTSLAVQTGMPLERLQAAVTEDHVRRSAAWKAEQARLAEQQLQVNGAKLVSEH
jgi:hypothetical protein